MACRATSFYFAADPTFPKIMLDRELATAREGEVSRVNKEPVAYASSIVNDGKLSIAYRAEALRHPGLTNEQLFEAATVVSAYAKNCTFSPAFHLEPLPA